jgi:hypothetical protein
VARFRIYRLTLKEQEIRGNDEMSGAIDDAEKLSRPRLPMSLGGVGRDSVYAAAVRVDGSFNLQVRSDRCPQAFVEQFDVAPSTILNPLSPTRGYFGS